MENPKPRGRRTPTQAYSGAWLAVKLGVEPREVDVRRRSGELHGVPVGKGTDYLYPSWQLDADGRPLPAVARIVAAARQVGLGPAELNDLLERRDGMTGSTRLLDALRDGREEHVLAVIRSSGRRRPA